MALLDIVASKDPKCDAKDPVKLRMAIEGLNDQNSDLRKALLAIFDSAVDDLKQATKNLEDWFDNTMDRVTGWYKKMFQWI